MCLGLCGGVQTLLTSQPGERKSLIFSLTTVDLPAKNMEDWCQPTMGFLVPWGSSRILRGWLDTPGTQPNHLLRRYDWSPQGCVVFALIPGSFVTQREVTDENYPVNFLPES